MAKVEIEVLSHYCFDEKMRELGFNDENVEEKKDFAFISIIGTPECLKYYLDEGETKHYFGEHPNVLNLDFDDISDDVLYDGHLFKGMSIHQAEKGVNFIEEMIANGVSKFYIHCRAGFSRSRAFGEFIYRYCKENDIEVTYEDREDYTTMFNQGVLNRLNHAYWKKHRLRRYEEEDLEYPDYIINPKIKIINRNK